MKDRLNGGNSLWRITLKQAVPSLSCKTKKPMERAKNGSRYFRNPPQPHMCIQDSIQGCNEPCYINVLSWIKISTPRRPEDPIPLYGGMRIPCSSATVMSFSADKKLQPIIFAVMANPEILRLSGKMAKDPTDRDALVDLMLDFVEAMNPDLKFNRQFSVLKDRDLTGELKDIWMAIQLKREREKERPENGRRFDMTDRDKHKDEQERCLTMGYDYDFQQRSNITAEEKVQDEKIQLLTHNSNEDTQFSQSETYVAHSPSSTRADGLVKLADRQLQQDSPTEVPLKQLPGISERDVGDASPTRKRKVKVKQANKLLTYSKDEQGKQPSCIKQAVFQEMPLSSSDSSEDEERAANEENAECIMNDNEMCNGKNVENQGVSSQCKNVESHLLVAEDDRHKTNGVKEGYFASVFHDKNSDKLERKENVGTFEKDCTKPDDTTKSKPLQSINANVFNLSSHRSTPESKEQQNFAAQIGRNSSFVTHDCKIVGLQRPRN